MTTTPVTAHTAPVQTEQVITLSTTSVAGTATIGFGAELNPDHVRRVLESQRQGQARRQAEQQRVYTQRQTVERPKPTKGQLLYSALPDGSIMLHAYALDYDRH